LDELKRRLKSGEVDPEVGLALPSGKLNGRHTEFDHPTARGRLDCCGFNKNSNHDCAGRTRSCSAAINQQLAKHSGAIGGSLVGFIVVSFIRAFSNRRGAAAGAMSHAIVQIREKPTRKEMVWF
jgi:hypothetical protein